MRGRAALREYLIDGIKTNIPLHLRILQEPDFLRGYFATDFLSRFEREPHPAEAVRAAGR
jgi:acetyl-CoA carboxylase biotin carboxylase subunit